MTRPDRRTFLAPLFAVLAILLGVSGSASGAFNHAATEVHYEDFLLWETKVLGGPAFEIADPTRGNGEWVYDDASGVLFYVKQNPWSAFDPDGLALAWLVEKFNKHISEPIGGALAEGAMHVLGEDAVFAAYDTVGGDAVLKGAQTVQSAGLGVLDAVVPGSETARTAETQIKTGEFNAGDLAKAAYDDAAGKKAQIVVSGGKVVQAAASGDGQGAIQAAAEGATQLLGGKSAKKTKSEGAQTTSRQARRESKRQEGIPTSQQPASQSRNASGREQSYEVPKPGGGTQKKSVQQQTMDRSHPDQGHWEAGKVKTDPLTGETRVNKHGRPKLTNDKSKVDYDK